MKINGVRFEPVSGSAMRALIEIALLAAVSFYAPPYLINEAQKALELSPEALDVFITFANPTIVLITAWLLLVAHREKPADIGLRKPKSWSWALIYGLVLATLLFGFVYMTEKLGFHRELSHFDFIKDNLPATLMLVLFAFYGAGFYEEVVFRGFILDRFLKVFGANKTGWVLAALAQGVIFGLGHFAQGVNGMLLTGALGFVFGLIFAFGGWNLWPLIIGHGLYDASRFVYVYVMLTYYGVPSASAL